MIIDDDDANVGEVVLDKSKINYIFYTLLCTGEFRNLLSSLESTRDACLMMRACRDMTCGPTISSVPTRRDNICLIEFISSMHSLIVPSAALLFGVFGSGFIIFILILHLSVGGDFINF